MYLVDFFKRLMRKSNIPVIIYLILNTIIICFFACLFFAGSMHPVLAVLLGILIYFGSLAVALSPVGEWILRVQTGCKRLTDQQQIDFIMPLFNEVYARARKLDPTISDKVELFINSDGTPNAFATGRKTICITEGLLRMPPEQIKAALGHEFGHLAHKDTDLILLVTIGNFIVTAVITFIRIVIEIFNFIMMIVSLFIGGSEGALAAVFTMLYRMAIMIAIDGLMWIWTKLGTLLVMKSSRSNEFEADAFSFKIGYGNALCSLLNVIGGGAQGLFATLASSHPDKHKRIAHLQKLGATYGLRPAAQPTNAVQNNMNNSLH